MGVRLMQSFAQKHLEQHQATGGQPSVVSAESRELQARHGAMTARIQAEMVHLRAIRSRELRNQRKRELLPEYADYLTAVINSGNPANNAVLVQCCIWALDCEQFSLCLKLADYAIQHGMQSPGGFTRTVPEILLEEMAWQASHSEDPGRYTPYLLTLADMTAGQDLTDEIRAKFHKALGMAQHLSNPEAALLAYRHAARYGAKVQTRIKQLEGEIDHE